ncbi:MAG TPA: DUF2721 domain-containing protein [Lacipirellulaceae bacterium]|nr:DUF2721 domain-containing protein [Lacipirellulaceae bacterium]
MDLKDLIPVLSTAIGPVIMFPGVGLLVLSMTRRFGFIIDRFRSIMTARRVDPVTDREYHDEELRILWRRARLLRTAIAFAAIAALLAAVLIIVLFVGVLLKLRVAVIVILLFISCLLALIGSLIYYLCEIQMSMRALSMELELTRSKG